MAENFDSNSTQPSMLVNFSGTLAAGSEITVTDAPGKLLVSFTPEKNYQCAVISTPELKVGETYTVTAGGQSQSVSFSSVIYGASSGMGGFGGGMGGGPGGFGGGPGGNQSGFGGFPGGFDGMPDDLPDDLPEDFDGDFGGFGAPPEDGDWGSFGEPPEDGWSFPGFGGSQT